eukprot:g3472.t1
MVTAAAAALFALLAVKPVDACNASFFEHDTDGRRAVTGAVSGAVAPPSPLAPTPAPGSPQTYTLDPSTLGPVFDGHGGLSAGGTSRALVDYPEPQRSDVLDWLFLPGHGAAMQVLKLEIGGDTQSTDGTEASHMHARGQLDCDAGYEGWLAAEARRRNPRIKVWSLAWGVPGWIGNVSGSPPTYYSDDNIAYTLAWLGCLRSRWGVESDLLGLWNERPQGSADYIVRLRQALDGAGFAGVGITMEATWQPLVQQLLSNATLNASVRAAGKHYPCNETCAPALAARKKFWASEDTQGFENGGNWSAFGCWGRKLNQHFIKMSATSVISWSALWAAYPGVSGHFFRNAPLTAAEPWSGHYEVHGSLWAFAHWHHFVDSGGSGGDGSGGGAWRFLPVRNDSLAAAGTRPGGAGFLAGGGSYVTLVPPASNARAYAYPAHAFTLIIETLDGSCGQQGHCNVAPISRAQDLTFRLGGALAGAGAADVWCTSPGAPFVRQPRVRVAGGALRLRMPPGALCTATSLLRPDGTSVYAHPSYEYPNSRAATSGAAPRRAAPATPPPPSPFPSRHSDDFAAATAAAPGGLPFGFADVYGSFAVRGAPGGSTASHGASGAGSALVQLATAQPTGWAPVNADPLTFIGNSRWTNVSVNVTALVNHTADAHGGGGHYVRVCAGGCGDTTARGLSYGCQAGCCLNLTWRGDWTLGAGTGTASTGTIAGFLDTWHDVRVAVAGASLTASVDGALLATVAGSCLPRVGAAGVGFGMAGLGCGKYHRCGFRAFSIEGH